MALQRNADQTISIAPKANPDALRAPRVPKIDLSSVQQDRPSLNSTVGKVNPTRRSLSPIVATRTSTKIDLDNIEINKDGYETIEEHAQTSIPTDIYGGLLQGITNHTFVANSVTHIKSWLPYAPAYIDILDDEGEFQIPEIVTVNEALNIPDDRWEKLSAQRRRDIISKYVDDEVNKFTGADPSSTSFLLGNLAGMLADPTTAIPIIGKTRLARAVRGAAVGGADMANYESVHMGGATATGVGMGVALGGGLSAAFGAKMPTRGHADRKVRQKAKESVSSWIETYGTEQALALEKGMSTAHAFEQTMKKTGVDTAGFDQILSDSGLLSVKHIDRIRTRTGFDKYLEPIAEEMSSLAPALYKVITDMERKSMQKFSELAMGVDDFLRIDMFMTKKIKPEAYNEIIDAMLVGDLKTFLPLAEKHLFKGWQKRFEMYQKSTDSAYTLQSLVRGKSKTTKLAPKIELYLHRAIKDRDIIRKALGQEEIARIDAIIAAARSKNKMLSKDSIDRIYNNFLAGRYDKEGMTLSPKGSKRRMLTAKHFKEHPELRDAFYDPAESMHSYFKSITDDSYRKMAFGQKIMDDFGDDIGEHYFGAIANREATAGRLSGENIVRIADLLRLRFEAGTRGPTKGWGMIKDTVLASLLGNPISAITQLGDIAIAASIHGLQSTAQGFAQAVGGRGLSPKEMGFASTIAEELASSAPTKRLLNKALSWSGFAAVDRLGKATAMNASLVKSQKLTKSAKGIAKLHAKWGAAYGDDFTHLLSDLSSGKITEHTKALAFAELADVQPITLMQMPAQWLEMRNGRLFYMLRTFQMKYFNLVRQRGYYAFKNGQYKEGIAATAMLTSAFALSSASTDVLKGVVLQRDVNFEQALFDGMLRSTGVIDRYSGTKILSSSDPMTDLITNMGPPITVASPFLATAMDFASTGHFEERNVNKMIKTIPLIGKVWENYVLGGAEESNAKHLQERIK